MSLIRQIWLLLLGTVLGLGIAAEITAAMWSSRYLAEQAAQLAAFAGAGAAFFTGSQALVRFFGDPLRRRFGDHRLVSVSLAVAACGFGFVGLVDGFGPALFGFAFFAGFRPKSALVGLRVGANTWVPWRSKLGLDDGAPLTELEGRPRHRGRGAGLLRDHRGARAEPRRRGARRGRAAVGRDPAADPAVPRRHGHRLVRQRGVPVHRIRPRRRDGAFRARRGAAAPARIIRGVKRARPPLVQGSKGRTGGRSGLHRAA